MKIPKTVEQACASLAIIAASHGEPVTNAELSQAMSVSHSYLTKITQKLASSGIIRSAHGARGGFILARPMTSISLRDVYEAVEGSADFFQPQHVLLQAFSHRKSAAKRGEALLQDAFGGAQDAWLMSLEHVTMEQLIASAKAEEEL